MPTVTNATVTAFAHCARARCPGHNQEQVPALREETSLTYIDLGGDIPGVERSMVAWRFANEDDQACPHCAGPRELSEKPRPQYDPLSAGLTGNIPVPVAKTPSAEDIAALVAAEVDRRMAEKD